MNVNILSNDFTVYFTNDTDGDKQIKWIGSATGTRSVNELYSALQDLFDNDAASEGLYMDEGIPMSTQTPTEYTIGEIESSDNEPWFIDEETIQHLKGGSLQTTGWTRTEGTDIGIIIITYTGTPSPAFDSGDIGAVIVHVEDNDAGKLLHYDTTNKKLWIRPDNSAAANSFNSGGGTMNITGGPQGLDQSAAAPISGENIWSNIYSLGSIVNETEIYVVQANTKLTQWWATGHIDILVLVQEMDSPIDNGILTVYARQYTQSYDHFETTVASGGRNPIPFSTNDDINNDTGYRLLNGSSGASDFDVANYIYAPKAGGWSAATKKGVITAIAGDATDPDITYYPIGDLTAFAPADIVQEYDPSTAADGDGDCTADTVADTEIASLSGITFTFGADSKDLSDGKGASPYDVVIDCGGNTLADFYEYTKYVTRRGSDTSLNGANGEQYYTPGTHRISYDTQTADFTEGATLTGQTSAATAEIVADHDDGTSGTLIIKTVRGDFDDSTPTPEIIQDDSGGPNGSATIVSGGIETTAIIKASPFGTFAGDQFFGARGVWIHTMHANDANNYQLTDSENVAHTPPASVSVEVGGLESGDRVTVFRTTGDNEVIDKTYIVSHATENAAGNGTWEASAAIPSDTPSTGYLRIVDTSLETEERLQYTGWNGAIFTLSGTHKGDYGSSDTAYVGYIDVQASGSSASQSITFDINHYVLTNVRLKGIIPFKIKGELDNTGYSSTAVRTTDSNIE